MWILQRSEGSVGLTNDMKTSHDPRHKRRQDLIQKLFASSFYDHPKTDDNKTEEILKNSLQLDEIIRTIAPEFPVDKINKIDLAILRLGVYELTIEKKEPAKVIIDEAIELAKEFGGDSSPAFINGSLGKYLETLQKNESTEI